MGGLCPTHKQPQNQKRKQPQKQTIQSRIQNIDVVKMKLKQTRDRIKTFVTRKQSDVANLDAKIKQKLPQYQRTNNKKILLPFLTAKKDLLKMIDQGQVRLKLVNQKLAEVQIQQLNKETIDVLDDSNKYIKEVQQQLQAKDWQNVLMEAKNKIQIEWPDDSQQIQNDPTFLSMWEELGGNKISKSVKKKQVNVELSKQQQNKSTWLEK